jgi:hypothetical protein
MYGISPCDALTIRAEPGLSGVHMVALWFAHTPPKMPVKTSGELFVLLTTYVVVHMFRIFCALLQECPCHHNDFPYGWGHNNMLRCKKKATLEHWILECASILLLVAGFILLWYIFIRYDVLEHRTALLLSLGLTTTITSILSLVCNRDAPN